MEKMKALVGDTLQIPDDCTEEDMAHLKMKDDLDFQERSDMANKVAVPSGLLLDKLAGFEVDMEIVEDNLDCIEIVQVGDSRRQVATADTFLPLGDSVGMASWTSCTINRELDIPA